MVARLLWVDVARGICILLVTVHHAVLWLDSYDLSLKFYAQIDKLFRPIRMPMFFTVAGFLAAHIIGSRDGYSLLKRVALYLYLYGIWSALLWILFHAFDLNSRNFHFGNNLIELATMWFQPETGFWFVWALAIYYVLGRVLFSRNRGVVLLLSAGASALTMSGLIDFFNFAQMNILWYAPFFLGGMWYGRVLSETVQEHPWSTLGKSLCIFLLIGVGLSLVREGLAFGIGRLLLSGFGLLMGSAAAVLIAKVNRLSTVFALLGRNSLHIFLCNEIIISVLLALCDGIFPQTLIALALLPPVIVMSAVGGSILVKRMVAFAGTEGVFSLSPTLRPFSAHVRALVDARRDDVRMRS